MSDFVWTLVGMPGSPYSRKLRAAMRYRRIPHTWVLQRSVDARDLPQPKVQLLPQLVGPTGPGGALEARVDSTPPSRSRPGRDCASTRSCPASARPTRCALPRTR